MKVQFKILSWLSYWWFPDIVNAEDAINEFRNKINLWSNTKGQLWVISHLKEMKLLYTRHLCGDPVKRSDHIIGIRKDGLPKGFPILNSIFLTQSDQSVRFTLTLVSISRSIKAWKVPSTDTITKLYSGLDFSEHDFQPFISKFLKDFGISVQEVNWDRSNYHYSIKAGPIGIATWWSIIDAGWLSEEQLINLSKLSEDLEIEVIRWRTFNTLSLWERMKSLTMLYTKISRKLSVIKDLDGKSRVIAILDYWTQSWMKLFHQRVFDILKELPQDRTFNQEPQVTFAGPYHSFDLSAATDRFPLKFQKILVKLLLNSKTKADAWAELLVGTPFYVPWTGNYVKYEVGQPMGAYSSWAIFSLSHHIIIQYCAFLIGEYPTKNYIILGDDIVIGGDQLASVYLSIMEGLGVEVSQHKTHVSTNTYEFAKRWFRNNKEVSPIQVSAFMETWKSYPLLFQTIKSYYERGLFPKRITTYPMLIFSLLTDLGMYPRKAANICRRVNMLNAFYRWVHNGDSELIRKVLITLNPDGASLPDSNHPIFNELMYIRYGMAYEVMHSKLVTKVNSVLESLPDLLANDSQLMRPDQSDDERQLDPTMAEDYDIFSEENINNLIPDEYLGYSDVNNHPVNLSLRKILESLSTDPRISIDNPNLEDAIEALVIPSIDNIKTKKVRKADVLVKTNILAQKVLHFHKVLKGAWMLELQWFNKLGIKP
jgi:hypothetical protein